MCHPAPPIMYVRSPELQVTVGMDPPNAGDSPYTGISRLYLQTS